MNKKCYYSCLSLLQFCDELHIFSNNVTVFLSQNVFIYGYQSFFSGSRHGNDDRVLPLHFYHPGKLYVDVHITQCAQSYTDIHNIMYISGHYIDFVGILSSFFLLPALMCFTLTEAITVFFTVNGCFCLLISQRPIFRPEVHYFISQTSVSIIWWANFAKTFFFHCCTFWRRKKHY